MCAGKPSKGSPPRGGRNHWQDTLSSVRACIKRWRNGDIVRLWSEVLEKERRLTQCRRPKKGHSELLLATNARCARCAVEDGQYTKATKALTSDSLAQISCEVLAKMLGPTEGPKVLPQWQCPRPFWFQSQSFQGSCFLSLHRPCQLCTTGLDGLD